MDRLKVQRNWSHAILVSAQVQEDLYQGLTILNHQYEYEHNKHYRRHYKEYLSTSKAIFVKPIDQNLLFSDQERYHTLGRPIGPSPRPSVTLGLTPGLERSGHVRWPADDSDHGDTVHQDKSRPRSEEISNLIGPQLLTQERRISVDKYQQH